MSAQCHFTWEREGPFKLTEMDAMTQISKIRPTLTEVKKKKDILEVKRKTKRNLNSRNQNTIRCTSKGS